MQISVIQGDFDACEDYLYWPTRNKKDAEADQSACRGHMPKSLLKG